MAKHQRLRHLHVPFWRVFLFNRVAPVAAAAVAAAAIAADLSWIVCLQWMLIGFLHRPSERLHQRRWLGVVRK